MKITNFLSLLLMSVICWSCSGKSTNSEKDSVANAAATDSVTTVKPAKAELLVTPDLTLLEVKGNVKEIKGKESDNYVYGGCAKFDEEGNLTHYGNSDPIDRISNAKRDSENRLTNFLGGEWITVTWTDDKPSSKMVEFNELSTTETYKYADNGLITEITYCTKDEIEETENTKVATIVYPEDAFDNRGNWIKRVVTYPDRSITQIREILYYQ